MGRGVVFVSMDEVPFAARVFPLLVGAGFLAFGVTLVLRSDALARWVRELVGNMGGGEDVRPFPKRGAVRLYGVIFSGAGSALIAFSLWLLSG